MPRKFAKHAIVAATALMSQLPLGLVVYPAPAAAASFSTRQAPEALVAEVYRHLIAAQGRADSHYSEPANIFTPRLKSLMAAARRNAHGEVPCGLDFDFWVNGQDSEIAGLSVARAPSPTPDRATVIATFRNMGTAEKIVFDFQNIGGTWLLDDVHSLAGDAKWTLSRTLRCEG